MDACGVEARECLLVGDRIDKDVIPARGLACARSASGSGSTGTSGPRDPSEAPDVELESVVGLADAAAQLA